MRYCLHLFSLFSFPYWSHTPSLATSSRTMTNGDPKPKKEGKPSRYERRRQRRAREPGLIMNPNTVYNAPALLAHRIGGVAMEPCDYCASGLGHFKQCVVVTADMEIEGFGVEEHGWNQNSCTNCSFGNRGNSCSFRRKFALPSWVHLANSLSENEPSVEAMPPRLPIFHQPRWTGPAQRTSPSKARRTSTTSERSASPVRSPAMQQSPSAATPRMPKSSRTGWICLLRTGGSQSLGRSVRGLLKA